MAKSEQFTEITVTRKPILLIVDDDELILDSLRFVLSEGFDIVTATSREEALQRTTLSQPLELALIDLGLPPHPHSPTEGLALITDLLAIVPEIKIVVLSGQNDDANARLARTLGATDFVGKPASPALLKTLLTRIANLRSSVAPGRRLLGSSAPILQLRQQLRQFAKSPFPVLIEGESGTGKELAAKVLHEESDRAPSPYLALNCAAMTPTLVEATLFGHAKGAFTGASVTRSGYFEDAAQGTLFLDEIGELPIELQPKLLRVLESGDFQRVGETQTRISSARIVAATNRDLREEVRAGRFRSDLYHRLSVFTVRMPALRELGNDRRTLLESFIREFSAQGKLSLPVLTDDAWACIDSYGFPGNVRELRNIAIRLTTKYADQQLTAREMEGELDIELKATAAADTLASETNAPATANERSNFLSAARASLAARKQFSLDDELRSIEAAYISAAQDIAGGNISHAARLLGVSRTTLYNRMESIARANRKPNFLANSE
ncbi:MAG: sigma-54-dependent Fis family transcriptional regulator [Rhodocyclaceae bacterium]|jgi:DNA-binding NtrC family response regulator|nr:sigma-54-dependent Fis family transcriptional regulator [Rhodocyclaceae bacterium]MBK6906726.1 sigma-54-dependent Fis family transcriptional regulator [Rhodocyclaceae bacterium]